jgi:hypothetical protein
MKFMVTWKLHPGKLHDAITHFSQMTLEQEMSGLAGNTKLIGRWHCLVQGTGVAICESDSAEVLSNWLLNWNSIMDFDIAPVLDDNETRALGKKRAKKR